MIAEDLGDKINPAIHISLISASTGDVTPFSTITKSTWNHAHTIEKDDPVLASVKAPFMIKAPCHLDGQLTVPFTGQGESVNEIGGILLRITWPERKKASPDGSLFIESIVLDNTVVVPIHSYIFPQQGTRFFGATAPCITQHTPKPLQPYRQADLQVTQGLRTAIGQDGIAPPKPPFQPWHRVYQSDVYNDLGGDPTKEEYQRPNLGTPALAYPRRIKTGRPLVPGTDKETRPENNENPYLPKNETFTAIRQQGFKGLTFKGVALSAVNVIANLGRGSVDFKSFHDIRSWFGDSDTTTTNGSGGVMEAENATQITRTRHASLKWPSPAVYAGRPDLWRSDEEFGRQLLAGQNPVTLTALTSLQGTQFSSHTVPPSLTEGAPLDQLVNEASKQPVKCRIFQLDYATILDEYADKVSQAHDNRVLTPTRCLVFARSDGALVPIAIEILNKDKSVYTPLSGVGLWMLAKMVVASNDSAIHQVVSHFGRTHAAIEPIIIASRRWLSLSHPINRLLQKHFVYTMQINAMARVSLINAGGVIERAFTTGRYSMEIGARVYGATWNFTNQALPNDLVSRGVAVAAPADKNVGGVRLIDALQDYPYAVDGLQIWDALERWMRGYVDLYYSSDAEVRDDDEIRQWWMEIVTVGHGDIQQGWPKLDGRQSLARILTTIAYIASAHHSAVNFGQYDFSGLLLNRSSKIRSAFPEKDSDVWKILKYGVDYEEIENIICTKFLAGPVDYATVLSVIEVLSAHDDAEKYLGDADPWVTDDKALELYSKFQDDLKQLATDIAERNVNNALVRRSGEYVVPYTLLIPKSGGGVTRQGVPNSISI